MRRAADTRTRMVDTIGILLLLGLVGFAVLQAPPAPRAPTYDGCRADCEASGRGVWAWSRTSCECTPEVLPSAP